MVVTDQPARVVIIDDTPDLRHLLTLMLSRYDGITVVGEAADGLEGIERVQEQHPDAVVLDLSMPGMDGLAALPHIKAAEPDCQVVVLSGFDAGPMRSQVLDAGASAYIQKGDVADELITALSRALDRELTRRVPVR